MKQYLFAILIFILPATRVDAVTWHVNKSGSDGNSCATAESTSPSDAVLTIHVAVQCAIDNGAAGNTIEVQPGTYDERLVDVLPGGTSWSSPFTLRATGTVILAPTTGEDTPILQLSTSFNSIEGFILDGTSQTQVMVRGYAGDNHYINLELRNVDGDSGYFLPSGTSGHLIRGGSIHDGLFIACPTCGGGGTSYPIYVEAHDSIVEGVTFYNFRRYGVHLNDGNNNADDNNIIRNNVFYNGSTDWPSGAAIVAFTGHNNQVYSNVVYNMVGHGIATGHGEGTLIYNNTIYNGQQTGILIDADAPATVMVRNNIAYNNTTVDIANQSTNSPTVDHNFCNTGACDVTGDPLFVDPANGDFHLQSTSPAIDNGVDLSSVFTTDFAGTMRPQGSGWDIGAYEAIPNNPPLLVLALSEDEGSGSTVTDSSGQANNGSIGSGVTWTSPGKYGNGLVFNGSGTLTVSNSNSLDVTVAFTLEAWVDPSQATSNWTTVMAKSGAYWLFATSNGECGDGAIEGGFYDGTNVHDVCYSTPLPVGQFTHLALSYDGTNLKLYVNGSLATSQAHSGSVVSTAGDFLLGNSSVNEAFTGIIDEVRIYNYARTQTEIQSDMATPVSAFVVAAYGFNEASGTTVIDSSGFNNTGTFGSGVTRTGTGDFGNGLVFEGTGAVSAADSASIDLITGFTLEAWVNPSQATSNWTTVMGKGGAYWLFATSNGVCGDGAIEGGFYDGTNVHDVCYSTPLPVGQFTHLALSYDGNNLTLFVNGVSITAQATTAVVVSTANNLLIGNTSVNEGFAGAIDEVRIYNYGRTQAQVQADMNTPI